MGFFSEAYAYGEALVRGSTAWTPPALAKRLGEAAGELVREATGDKLDVTVIAPGDGVINNAMGALSFVTDQADNVVWQPESPRAAINGVLEQAKGKTIRSLKIVGHGRSGVQGLGEQRLAQVRFGVAYFAPGVEELGRVMDDNTIVTLGGCNVGSGEKGETLARGLAKLWGVEVRAADAAQRPGANGMQGSVIACRPDSGAPDGVSCERAANEFLLSSYW